jgi:hypothetical protein
MEWHNSAAPCLAAIVTFCGLTLTVDKRILTKSRDTRNQPVNLLRETDLNS